MPIPQRYIENYFKRFATPETLIKSPIDSSCQMIVVIPCHNEPNLIDTLESIKACTPLNYKVEVIIVVNDKAENENPEVRKQNTQTTKSFYNWNKGPESNNLVFHLIEALEMPRKTAGVGLARKIGMDEALRRFHSINKDGAIVCLDADCTVSKNYFSAIDSQFIQSNAGLGEMHYKHPFEKETNASLSTGIVNYELFLRYYVEGLKQAGFPYAIQTVGSCMLVRASVYAKHGGMNKRKAGEDFYFLHKIIPHEKFVEVNKGIVYPSCRTSDRVPFGTGKAQQDWLDQDILAYLTYNPRVFEELKILIGSVSEFYQKETDLVIDNLPEIPKAFIRAHEYSSKIELIKSNCKTLNQFKKQFFIWFDGFICMKFVHFVRDQFLPNIPIEQAIKTITNSNSNNLVTLLKELRQLA